MKRVMGVVRFAAAVALLPVMLVQQSLAWGADGHKMINRLAGAALPSDVPEFLRSPQTLDALAYYGPIPDHWRESTEPELNAAQSPEHFLDMEYAEVLGELPRKRYDYARALAEAQKTHPELTLTPEKVGMLPYETVEMWERLKVGMWDYRKLKDEHKDTKAVEAEIVYLAGWLGHFVADGSQPLHATYQFNGWTGPNPNGYTTDHKFHSKFETAFVSENVKAGDVASLVGAKPVVIEDVFVEYMKYLKHSNSLVEKTYQLEKAGAFTGAGTPEGLAFVDERMAAGVTELRDLIYTAWVRSADPIPVYHGPM